MVEPVPAPVAPVAPAPTAPPPTTTYDVQLTQVRVPISDAADAFTVPDAEGRFPIVVLTGERSRIRNEFVAAGVIAIVVSFFFELNLALRGGLAGVGVLLLFLGVFQSFRVMVPEGSQALTLRRGRFDKAIPAGMHFLPPWVAVTHVVTKREIPFLAPGRQVPTADGVRVDIDLLLTFAIEAADRFVFSISAPDFDLVCNAASQDALRRLVRGIGSSEMLDLAGKESDELRTGIGEALEAYGVTVNKVVIMAVRPPADYMASLEARRLAEVQQAEQTERHKLELRRQADGIDLERQAVEERKRLIALEAANETLRLEQLQARLAAYPEAARWDVESQRLDVARALAGNERALLSVGDPARLMEAYVGAELREDVARVANRAASGPARAIARPAPRRKATPPGG
jgi:regulator of protease activity HflC (stomatin/prohibitin superfamily)